MREVGDATFDAEVLGGERPVVVDFWAPWCGPCHAHEPLLKQLEDEDEDSIDFVRVNVDQNPVTASRYGVLSLPTAMLFEGGETQETVIGARPAPHFERASTWLARGPFGDRLVRARLAGAPSRLRRRARGSIRRRPDRQ